MSWDDGKHKKVKKIQVTFDGVINSIEVEYDGTSLKSQPRGTVGTKSDGFTLSSDEYITEVNGYSRTVFSGDVITALTFKTNKKTYGPYGNKSRNYFSVNAPNGNQIAGFLGTSGNALNSIDVHFAPIPPAGSGGGSDGGNTEEVSGGSGGGGSNQGGGGGGGGGGGDGSGGGGGGGGQGGNNSNPQKVGPEGGKRGNEWDDTANHDGVTKIYIVHGTLGIEQIKFDYVKNGETKEGTFHGVKKGGSISTIEINHPNEYLVSVKGWYATSNIIQGIRFKTNTNASYFIGYEFGGEGKEFLLEVKGKKIIGFHGFADSHLNSLGAYFVPITSTPLKPGVKRLDAIGGDEGVVWDDGAFDGVRKVDIGDYEIGVSHLKIEYNKDSKIISHQYGQDSMVPHTFVLDYPSEYITALKGTYDKFPVGGVITTVVVGLTFVTNKQTSRPYGLTAGKEFEIKEEGHKIVGFHGKAGDSWVHQIGVYVAPITN